MTSLVKILVYAVVAVSMFGVLLASAVYPLVQPVLVAMSFAIIIYTGVVVCKDIYIELKRNKS